MDCGRYNISARCQQSRTEMTNSPGTLHRCTKQTHPELAAEHHNGYPAFQNAMSNALAPKIIYPDFERGLMRRRILMIFTSCIDSCPRAHFDAAPQPGFISKFLDLQIKFRDLPNLNGGKKSGYYRGHEQTLPNQNTMHHTYS